MVTASRAAYIAETTSQTIRTWCEATDGTDWPLGMLMADSLWLVDADRLLDQTQARRDLHARRVAEGRLAEKSAQIVQPKSKSA